MNALSSISITGPEGNAISPGREGDRVRVYESSTSSSYEVVLSFSAVSQSDAGIYTCNGVIMPATPNTHVMNAVGRTTFSITLMRKSNMFLIFLINILKKQKQQKQKTQTASSILWKWESLYLSF